MKVSAKILGKVEDHKEKIGQLLLQFTSLSPDQLEEALNLQKETGMMIGEILLKKNYIHPHDITKVLCQQINIPYVNELKIDDIDPNLVLNIPITYAKQHELLPILETEESLTLALTDPFNFDAINDIQEVFKKRIDIIITSPLRIIDAINRIYEKVGRNLVHNLADEFEENMDLDGPIDILDAGADEAPVIRFVNSVIFRAIKERASDIHIEPYEKESVYRFRINRVMTEVLRQPIKTHAAVSSRIKVMAKMDIAEKRLPQDNRIKLQMGGKDIDLRVSTVPIQHGERIVMRVLEKDNTILKLEKLGFHGSVLKKLDSISKLKHGVVYVSGPTGHGKTTTLFALLDRINQPDKMIITVEDPVEYEIQGISQIQVNSKIELSFARALRSILRQNPDVIMVGETRDHETAEMAIQASLTGHFVLSTVHTNDAPSVPTRLIDMGVEPFLIASSLSAALAQRLIRTLCPHCKEAYVPNQVELEHIGVKQIPPGTTFFRPVGCAQCNFMGYAGMTSVCELLIITDEIRTLIVQRADASAIKRKAVEQGMIPLRRDALDKVLRGQTSVEEMIKAINAE